jgi:hypothetical protein
MLDRRSFLAGIAAVAAAPAIPGPSPSPVACDQAMGGFDILYGYLDVRPEWCALVDERVS